MSAPHLVFIHSPFVGPYCWSKLSAILSDKAVPHTIIRFVSHTGVESPPYWEQQVTEILERLHKTADRSILVGHSGAGPLLPLVATARPDAVIGMLFVDALLPGWGNTRLEILANEKFPALEQLRSHLEAGGSFPTWSADDLAEHIADHVDRELLVAELQPQGLEFFTETIPSPPVNPAPSAYLLFSPTYAGYHQAAVEQGWTTRHLPGSHFHMLNAPQTVTQAILNLAMALQLTNKSIHP